ncbi:MAG: hypothetical protein KGL59_01245 [Acidobacteriota bacterium]|nr:hypothetical protein [Acidobacteriota bacterium]
MRIRHDHQAPTASIELPILHPLPDYDLEEIERPTPRDVDPLLASQGFKDLLDEARAVVERETAAGPLEIAQLTGAICHEGNVHRPGLWLVVRESGAPDHTPMSPEAQAKVEALATTLRETLGIG